MTKACYSTIIPPNYMGPNDKVELVAHSNALCFHVQWWFRGFTYRTCFLANEEVAVKLVNGAYFGTKRLLRSDIKWFRPLCKWADGDTTLDRELLEKMGRNVKNNIWSKWNEDGTELIQKTMDGWPDGWSGDAGLEKITLIGSE